MTTVVVTGASRGIGAATAVHLASRHCHCVLLGRSAERLAPVLAECRARHDVDHMIVECDVSDPDACERAAATILQRGAPRALVNNAGIVERASLEALTLQSFRRQLDTNLLGPMWLTRALLPAMRQVGCGSVVNVGSISSTLGTAHQTAYNASKWALVGFTKSLAAEVSDSGLAIVAVLPGAVDTTMLAGGEFPPRMTADEVARTLAHYALDVSAAHNGGVIEMFGL